VTILGRILGERRMLTPQQSWARGLTFGARASTGDTIDLAKAMTLPVFQRCVNLYVDDIAQLPWDVSRKVGEARVPIEAPEWMERPALDPSYTWTDHVSDVVFSLVTDRNAFIRCYPNRYSVTALEVLDPEQVTVSTSGSPVYRIRGTNTDLTPLEVVHIRAPKSPGRTRATSRVDMLRESIALGLAAEQFGGQFFADGATMSGMVEVPVGSVVDPVELRRQLDDAHKGKDRAHAIGVLTGGATWKQTQSTARDAQLIELKEAVVEDVARGFGIPPYLVGSTSPGAVAYASTSNARVDHVVHGIVGLVHRIEIAYSALIPGADTFTRIGLNALLRGDQTSRYQAYTTGLQNRFIKVDEVRGWEDLEPFGEEDGGGFLETPNNNVGGESAAEPAERSITINTPPVTVSTPDVHVTTSPVSFAMPETKDVDALRAADLMVTDSREQMELVRVDVAESRQQTLDFVETRLAQVEERFAAAEALAQAERERISRIAPITREVTRRDESGRPIKIVERRGDVEVHKIVDRDPDGRILRVTEVAA
jgi:HK97 family phage portal protein